MAQVAHNQRESKAGKSLWRTLRAWYDSLPGLILWPTTRGWVVCLSGIAWIMVAMVNHALFALILGWACVALTGVSLLCACFSLHGIKVTRASGGEAVCGQLLYLPLRITNEKWRRRQPIIVQERLPFALEERTSYVVPPMGGHSEMTLERQVLPVRRGEYRLPWVILRGGDPAGLFCRKRKVRLPISVVVYPSLEEIPDLRLPQDDSFLVSTGAPAAVAGSSQDFYGIREYIPSDGMRNIHWRSSARCRKLMVKEFERTSMVSVVIFLDAYKEYVDRKGGRNLERLISRAASIFTRCSNLYCSVAFASGGSAPVIFRPKVASELRGELMYHLATMTAGDVKLGPMIDELAPLISPGATVFCLRLNHQDKEVNTAITAMTNMGIDVRMM